MRKQPRKQKSGVYAGSFDPLTVGHMWMIEQGARLFDRLTIAVGVNPDKKYTFALEDRLNMLRESTTGFANASVASFSNRYLIHYAQWQKIVRKYVPQPVYRRLLNTCA
jgi:pantetheine-phosphate adenylyltransferase